LINALRTAVRRGRLKEPEAAAAALRLERLPVESVPTAAQGHGVILSAALEHGLTGYDAAFFALARAQGAQLVTNDDDLLRLRPRFPWILSLEDFCAQLGKAC
jgi:predicted nucleic acid-binding protein